MTGKHVDAEMRRRGRVIQHYFKTGTGGQHCYVGDPVVSKFICPVAHLSTRRGLLPLKACGGSYHSTAFHVFMCAGVQHICGNNHAVGKRTVGVKVNVSNTEIYVFP